MKKNLPVTQKEKLLAKGVELVSATDVKGITTHANQAFVDISGFGQDELVGTNHNIVRHPDMPPAAFQNLWDTLKSGRSWMGVVKNRAKSGDHYWVDAFVSPSFEGDKIVGYESVRVAPEKEAVARAEALYKTLWSGPKRLRLPTLSLQQKLAIGLVATAATGIFGAAFIAGADLGAATLGWFATSLLGLAGNHLLLGGLRTAARSARDLVDNPAMQFVYTGRNDEIGNLEFAIRTLRAQLRTVLGRIRESACAVSQESRGLNDTAMQMSQNMVLQQREIDMVATAIEEMSASVREVARSATNASAATEQTNLRASAGQRAVDSAIASTRQVAESVHHAAETIQSLDHDSAAIDAVLVVIRSIAEQTNLLALNAAIEAARAGEQGRGFAVVADEVRTLASRTQASTTEIQTMIERLQSTAREAVRAMDLSHERVGESVESTQQVGIQLQEIFGQVASLEEMSHAIATAAEQQSSVSEEISRNVHQIGEAAINLSQGSQATRQIGEDVSRQATDLESLITRFRA